MWRVYMYSSGKCYSFTFCVHKVCVLSCVSLRERERGRLRETERERERQRDRVNQTLVR